MIGNSTTLFHHATLLSTTPQNLDSISGHWLTTSLFPTEIGSVPYHAGNYIHIDVDDFA